MQYSVIIPAHNEAAHIEAQVTRFVEGLPSEAADLLQEIILVENGSRDGTLDACRRLERKFPTLFEHAPFQEAAMVKRSSSAC